MELMNDRAWADIDIDALLHNYHTLRDCVSGIAMMPVIKADAYGAGAVMFARVLAQEGAEYFAVATIDEALQLRAAGIKTPVLILGYTSPKRVYELLDNDITQSLYALDYARMLAAELAGEPRRLRVHIKVETGMHRSGFENAGEIREALSLHHFDPEGIFTHFALADDRESSFTYEQYDVFRSVIHELSENGFEFKYSHCCNSPGITNFPELGRTMARPGISLHGYSTDPTVRGRVDLRPVLSLRARVSGIKHLRPGDTVSYCRTYTAEREMKLATVSIGYADGVSRALRGKLDVLLRGVRCPVVGRICMDYMMVDCTNAPDAAFGDVVTLIGRDGDEQITMDEWVEKLDTVQQETLCAVSARVPRIYYKDGKVVGQLSYLRS